MGSHDHIEARVTPMKHDVTRESTMTDNTRPYWKRIAFTCSCGFMGAFEGIPSADVETAFLDWSYFHEGHHEKRGSRR